MADHPAKRPAFRAAFAGFDPEVVAAFGPADRERLMADAGIVRNGRKVDAAVANAAAVVALREHGGLDALVWSFAPREHPRPQSWSDVPATTPAVGSPSPSAQGARARLRRPDDGVRRHAGLRAGRRPRRGLPPGGRVSRTPTASPRVARLGRFLPALLAVYMVCRLVTAVVLSVVAERQVPTGWNGNPCPTT